MVTSSDGTWSARITNTVVGAGSSIVFSSIGAWRSARCISPRITTRRVASTGVPKAIGTICSRICSAVMAAPSGSQRRMSGCSSASTSSHVRHSPQPPSGHTSAAASAVAAARAPPPGGPTSRYACTGCTAAARSCCTARSWPGTASHTVMAR
jgi:hypothetical protein